MKTLYLIISMLMLTVICNAQETRFFDSFEEAEKVSKEAGIPLMIYFSGSDWCKPCIKMKKDVLLSAEFAAYSTELAIYIADFPFRTKQSKELKKANEALAEKYNPKGVFPNLVLLNSKGDVLHQVSYKKQTAGECVADLKSKY